MPIFNKNNLQSDFSSLSVTLFIQVGNYLSFSLVICLFFHISPGPGTNVLQFIQTSNYMWCALLSAYISFHRKLGISWKSECCTRVNTISRKYITTHDHCVTFMVISANRFLLSCSTVNHDALPSLLWDQIFTNVILMKSDSCTLVSMTVGGTRSSQWTHNGHWGEHVIPEHFWTSFLGSVEELAAAVGVFPVQSFTMYL